MFHLIFLNFSMKIVHLFSAPQIISAINLLCLLFSEASLLSCKLLDRRLPKL